MYDACADEQKKKGEDTNGMKHAGIALSLILTAFLALSPNFAAATTCQSGGALFEESEIVWSLRHKAHLYCAGNDEWRYLAQWGVPSPGKMVSQEAEVMIRGGHITTTYENGAMVFNSGPQSASPLAGFWFRSNDVLGKSDPPYTDLIRITADGSVGIGTSTPDHHLSVVDNSDGPTVISLKNNNATGSKARSVLFLRGNDDTTSHSGGLMYANTSFTLGANYESLRPQGLSLYTNPSASGGISIASASPTGVFTINTGGLGQSTERLRIMADGNVGIGTSSPSATLHVNGTTRTGQLYFHSGQKVGSLGELYNLTSSDDFVIGQVEGSGAEAPSLSNHEIIFMNADNNSALPDDGISFYNSGTSGHHLAMRILGNGSIGIGTATPTQKLQVDGAIDVTDNRILRVATPTAITDAANKAYVDSLGGKSCTNGQVLKWNGTAWACAGDNIGAGGDNLGNHTATDNLMPSATNAHNMGSTFNRWKDGYFEHLESRTVSIYRAAPAANEYSDAYALIVGNSATIGRGTAIRAYTSNPSGYGIVATGANSGNNGAAYFDSISPSANVVNIQARSSSGNTYGMTVYASQSPNGTGIMTSGGLYGLDGRTTNGRGVRGWASGSTGTNYGVFGQTNSPDGYGVYSNGRMHSTGALTVGSSVTATSFTGNGNGLTTLNASNLAAGTVPIARIGTGTKNASTFLRGDGTFAVPPSGADNLGNHTATANLNMSNRAITADVGVIRDASGGWVRTYNNTGWYNQTYGGGWYMTDATWIRAYSNKSVVTGGNMQAAAFLYGSDERLKADIRPLGLSLDDLDGIHAYRYHYKADEDETPRIGVIAQEVQAVFPEAVQTGEDGMMRVDYPALVPVLLDAVKQLKAENDAIRRQMKADNDNLRMEIRALTKGAR